MGGPAGTAIRERRVAVSQNVEEAADDRWRETALEREFRAVAAVPLEHEETLYGLLSVYAGQPEAFSEIEQAFLKELGEDISHAIHSIETRTALREERNRREAQVQRLEQLHKATRELFQAGTAEEVA